MSSEMHPTFVMLFAQVGYVIVYGIVAAKLTPCPFYSGVVSVCIGKHCQLYSSTLAVQSRNRGDRRAYAVNL